MQIRKWGSYKLETLVERTGEGEVWLGRLPGAMRWQNIFLYGPHLTEDEYMLELLQSFYAAHSAQARSPHLLLSSALTLKPWAPGPPGERWGPWGPQPPQERWGVCWDACSGQSLGDLMRGVRKRRQPLDLSRSVQIVLDLCRGYGALDKVFEVGGAYFGAELKSDCAWVGGDGAAYVHAASRPAVLRQRDITGPGVVRGQFAEIAPEVARAMHQGEYTVVYWLAYVLYTLSTAHRPFEDAATDFQLLESIIKGGAAPPRQHNPEMSAQLEALIVRGMSVEPKARHQSLGEWEAALLALGFDMRQEPDLEDANRTLGWFRQRLYDGDTTAVLGAFERHPELKEQAAVVQYVWSHTEGRVFEALARSEVPDWTTVLLMGHLQPASLALEDWCKAQDGSLGASFGARWLRSQPQHAMPQAKLNALVGVGGARNPEVLPRLMAQTVGSVALEPCAVSWDELEPIPNVRDTSQRFCSHCQQTVSCALNQGQLLSLVLEGQCVRYAPQSSGSPFRDVPPLSASGEDDFPMFASSEVVEQGDDESPPPGSLLRRLIDWWRR